MMWVKILEDNITVYAEPDANSRQIGNLNINDEVRFGRTFFKDGDRWNKVWLPDGSVGYAEAAECFRIKKVIINQTKADLYPRPTIEEEHAKRVYKNSFYYLINRFVYDGDSWYELRNAEGKTYYTPSHMSISEGKLLTDHGEIERHPKYSIILVIVYVILSLIEIPQKLVDMLPKVLVYFLVAVFVLLMIISLVRDFFYANIKYIFKGPPKKRD